VAVVIILSAQSPQLGERQFVSSCAGCHGLDGRGGEHGPNIATAPNLRQLSDPDLLRVVRDGRPASGMPAFRSMFDEEQLNAVLAYLRFLQGRREAVSVRGDPERGQALFFGKARCSECHMVNGRGGFIASDLSAYDETHSAAQVKEAIPHIDQKAVTVSTRDGRKYTGVLRNEDNFSLQLQTLDGAFHFFEKSALARVVHQSLMPAGYSSLLSPDELDDVVSCLLQPLRRGPN
jgi:cytochrome c oxidase cbb3-type subunit III